MRLQHLSRDPTTTVGCNTGPCDGRETPSSTPATTLQSTHFRSKSRSYLLSSLAKMCHWRRKLHVEEARFSLKIVLTLPKNDLHEKSVMTPHPTLGFTSSVLAVKEFADYRQENAISKLYIVCLRIPTFTFKSLHDLYA